MWVDADGDAHDPFLWYTNEDNGIWVECQCGWTAPMGYAPYADDVNDMVAVHRAETPDPQDWPGTPITSER